MSNKDSDKPIDEKPDDVSDPNLEDGLQELTDAEENAAKNVQDAKDAEEKADKKPPVQEYEDDPRDEIEEAIIGKSAEKDDTPEGEEDGNKADPDQQDADALGADKQPPEDDPDDPLLTVKVQGEKRQVRQSQLVRDYQKTQAADKRLQEATELLRQAKEASAPTDKPAAEQPTGETTSDDRTDDSSTASPELDEKLANIAEQIQVGDTKEAAEALKEIIAEARKGQPDAPQGIDDEQVNAAVLAARERERSRDSLKAFRTDNPELENNKRLQTLMETEVADVMKEQLKTALQTEGYADDDIATIDTFSQEQVVTAHRTMRANGVIDHDTGQVLTTAKERLSKANLWPSTGKEQTDRSERKRNALQQPGQRSKPPGTRQQKTPGVQTPSEIVAEEQEARGNPAI